MDKKRIYNLVITSVLAALVVVLQIFASGLHIGAVTFSFVLVPIVLGSIIVGPYCGLFLGEIFGLITLFAGITGADPFTNVLWNNAPLRTAIICIVKAGAAGFVPGLIYQMIMKGKNRSLIASLLASASAPVLNTGLFVLISMSLSDVLQKNFAPEGVSTFYFLVILCAGINFLVEFATTIIITPTIFLAYKKAFKR